jgi:hypothetical protein
MYTTLQTFPVVEEAEATPHGDSWDCWCEPMIVWVPCSSCDGPGIQIVQHG